MTSPRHPMREVFKSARMVDVRLEQVVTRSRVVVRRLPCVVSALAICCHCGATWRVRLGKRCTWRRCPRGCNRHALSKG